MRNLLMYDESWEDDWSVDMAIEEWQIEKDRRQEANYNNHAWRRGYRVPEEGTDNIREA